MAENRLYGIYDWIDMSGVTTVTSLTGVPITSQLVIANISASTSFALASIPTKAGADISVIINNTGSDSIDVAIPSTGNYINLGNDTISIDSGEQGEINLVTDGSNVYIKTNGKSSASIASTSDLHVGTNIIDNSDTTKKMFNAYGAAYVKDEDTFGSGAFFLGRLYSFITTEYGNYTFSFNNDNGSGSDMYAFFLNGTFVLSEYSKNDTGNNNVVLTSHCRSYCRYYVVIAISNPTESFNVYGTLTITQIDNL